MKKREMIKEIQRHELVLRCDMFVAEDVLGIDDSASIMRLRIWGAHTSLMDNLGIEARYLGLKDTDDLQQVINNLTFSETFLGKR